MCYLGGVIEALQSIIKFCFHPPFQTDERGKSLVYLARVSLLPVGSKWRVQHNRSADPAVAATPLCEMLLLAARMWRSGTFHPVLLLQPFHFPFLSPSGI